MEPLLHSTGMGLFAQCITALGDIIGVMISPSIFGRYQESWRVSILVVPRTRRSKRLHERKRPQRAMRVELARALALGAPAARQKPPRRAKHLSPAFGPAHGRGGMAKHPGFKAVQGQIARKEGVSKERAGAMLAASTRKASAGAKRRNSRLKRVKG